MIDPVFFKLGPFEIRYYGILMVLAFLTGYYILKKLTKEKAEIIDDYLFYTILSAIIGARLFEVLFYDPKYYFSNPIKIFYLWEGGIASHGAIIGVFLMTLWFCKKNKINFWNFGDDIALSFALPVAFIRIGNFVNGELVGKVTSSSWGVKFDNYEGIRHPVQLYQAGANILNFIILYTIKQRKKLPDGVLLLLFFIFYSFFRFVTEFFKDLPLDYGFFYLGLNLAQWASLIIILISSYLLLKRFKKL